MTRPSQARGRRGIKQEAAELATRRGPGRPPKSAAAPAATVSPAAPTAPVAAVAQPPSEHQGAQLGLMVRAMMAPLYLAICGYELPAEVWKEWGIAGGQFAAYYFPNIALHPGAQFASASAMLVVPIALAWPAYAKKREAAQAAAEAAKRAAGGGGDNGAGRAAEPPAPPPTRPGVGGTIGGGWGARDLPPT